jgi:hypothetical protein
MTVPSPAERPDLYDAYDLPDPPRKYTVEHWMSITPEPIKQMLEQKLGKPFAEIAQDMEAGKL